MSQKKIRLDELLLKYSYVENKQKATSSILSGSVLVNGVKKTKVGELVPETAKIEILEKISKFVGRGAYKLQSAIDFFNPIIKNKICLDLGASTGGFTEILLLNDAKKVYAFDVGYGQMSSRLQNDNRVIIKDRFNVRELNWLDIQEDLNELFIVMDLSFISLLKIFPVIKKLKLEKKNVLIECISLIKPQFEVEQNQLVKGIVKNPLYHFIILKKILRYLKKDIQAEILGLCNSAIKGNSGNKEFFVYWKLK